MERQEEGIHCPYCGEYQTVLIDPSDLEEETYIEDCQVCCRPIYFHLSEDIDGSVSFRIHDENDM